RQRGQSCRVRFTFSKCLQHSSGTGAQQIGDQAGQLDVSFFQQRLQVVLQPDVIARPTGAFFASLSATAAARHQAQSSASTPAIPVASPSVRHLGNPSCVPAARDWTGPAPNAMFQTSALRLRASRRSVSNTSPASPTLVSNIGPSIP